MLFGLLGACTGSDGFPGESGESEPATLVATTTEASGVHCPAGGVAIQSGRDDDGDGQLAAAEVDDTSYLCSPLGTPPSLARVDVEPPGAHCAGGGSAVHSGIDADHDGELSDAEVTATSYVCAGENGSPGADSLIRIDAEPPSGGHCPAGGQAIKAGLDLDDDGVLADVEVQTTTYLCNPIASDVIEGSVTIRNSLDAAGLVGVRRITGDLVIDAFGLTSIDVSALEQVDGRVALDRFSGEAFVADELHTVGELSVQSVKFFSASALTTTGSLAVYGATPELVWLPSVMIVDGAVGLGAENAAYNLSSLTACEDLTIYGGSLDANSLHTVANLGIYAPAAFHLDGLTHAGSVSIGGDVAGTGLPALTTVHHGLAIGGVTHTAFDLGHLESLGGLYLWGNPDLAISLPAITSLDEGLDVANSGTLALPALASADTISVGGDQASTFSFPALATVEDLLIYGDGVTSFAAPLVTTLGSLRLSTGPQLATVSLPLVTALDSLSLWRGSGVSLPLLASVGILEVYNTTLETLSFPSLTLITDELTLYYNTELVAFDAPLSAGLAVLDIRYNSKLPTCRAAQIEAATQPSFVAANYGGDDNATCP